MSRMTDFEKLPKEIRDRVHFQNDIIDDVCSIFLDAEKADFIVRLLQEETKHRLKTPDATMLLAYNRICKLIEIADDYTYKVVESLKTLDDRLNEATTKLKNPEGGGI